MEAFIKKGITVDLGVCQENEESAIILLFLPKKVIPFRIEGPEKNGIIQSIKDSGKDQ